MALETGQFAEVTRSFSAPDIADYEALGGQAPPDGELPEPLIGALFSYLLGVKLPGIGTNYLKQESEFVSAAQVDESLTARVEIIRIRPEKHLVDLKTSCTGRTGELICKGRALVYIADVAE